METEFEATFLNIDKDAMRERLRLAGALLVRPEFLQKRIPFDLPQEKREKHAWIRVRDEGDKVTMSLKRITGTAITDQKELCLVVDDFDRTVQLLEELGCRRKSYQETKRELWTLGGAEVTIDEWPFLEPFVEVEAATEEIVRTVSEQLGFIWKDAYFGPAGGVYKMKYGIAPDEVNELETLVFDMPNPFV